MQETGLTRVTLTLDPIDVALLDRLAKLEGLNRSAELRGILSQIRPMLRATVEAYEAAHEQREKFNQESTQRALERFQELLPAVEKMQGEYLGIMAHIEGLAAAEEAGDPRPSNHGGHTPTPPPEEPTS